MKRVALVAALLATTAIQIMPATAASRGSCYTAAALEAEEAIRYMTDLMIVSSTCKDTVYAEFRLRNKDAIIHYQRALITHFHGSSAFDSWNTTLANESARRGAGIPSAQFCRQSIALLNQAKALDAKAFHDLAAAKAAAAGPEFVRCGRR
ncbi:MAG TPA: hypothetical protein VFA12_15155 [Stellaceae bacterium]|nr:hypothetical protein [Stellaceae bacterium]